MKDLYVPKIKSSALFQIEESKNVGSFQNSMWLCIYTQVNMCVCGVCILRVSILTYFMK